MERDSAYTAAFGDTFKVPKILSFTIEGPGKLPLSFYLTIIHKATINQSIKGFGAILSYDEEHVIQAHNNTVLRCHFCIKYSTCALKKQNHWKYKHCVHIAIVY